MGRFSRPRGAASRLGFLGLSLLVALAACGDSANETTADAGVNDGPDSSVAPGAPDAGVVIPADAGADGQPDAAPAVVAKITSFGATPRAITAAGAATLLAQFTGKSATVDHGVGAIKAGVPVVVSPAASTLYTLTVNGDDGTTATATTSVDVFDTIVTVTNTDPSGAGSLAAAMDVANASAGSTAITFNLPDPSTIELGATLISSGNATLFGPGAGKLTFSGRDERRIFFVQGGALTMSGVTLTHGLGAGGNGGSAPSGGGGGGAAGMGGAMFINAGTVTLHDLVVSNSVARGGNGGASPGNGFANGGGGGGFDGSGINGSGAAAALGGPGGGGGALGGAGGAAGANATGDGGGGGGAGAGAPQNGGSGGFGGGGGGSGGFPNGGSGGFGGGAGGGANASPGTFGGAGAQRQGGGGAGLGGAVFLRAGTLAVTNATFNANSALAGTATAPAVAGKAKAGAIFAMVPTVTLTKVTYTGSVAADATATPADNADVFLTP